ncbi:hypothetical protein ACM66B_006025 [Microbotryomycetes sp. NB124-2]
MEAPSLDVAALAVVHDERQREPIASTSGNAAQQSTKKRTETDNPSNQVKKKKTRKPRQGLSCLECRRLKLKCNRVWPCEACQRRGCADLCPDKVSQPQSRTTRMTNELQALNNRVQLLEQALTYAGLEQAIPPPLKLEFGAAFKDGHEDGVGTNGTGVTKDVGKDREGQDPEDQDEYAYGEEGQMSSDEIEHALAGGVGSLSIHDDGRARFLGLSAGSAYYHDVAESSDSATDEDDEHQEPPQEMTRYPFIQMGNTYPHVQEIERLRGFLPNRQEIERLARNYYDFLSFQFQPVDEPVFFDDYLTSAETAGNAHGTKLACVFMVLSLGSLFDPLAPSTPNTTAQHYFVLSWSTLSAARFLSHTTLAGVQTLQLCANFLLNAHDFQEGGETFWPILGMALRILVSMGLHRDGTQWNLQNPDLDRRRTVFWELVTLERMQALISGRPYMISTRHYDTKMPPNAEPFHQEKWKCGTFIVKVIDEAFSVQKATYSTISSLDAELRELFRQSPKELRCGALPEEAFDVKRTTVPSLPRPVVDDDPSHTLKFKMRQHTLDMIFSQILFYLHLPALRQALSLYPDDPLSSPWADSVRTVSLETGVYMLAIARSWIKLHSVLCPRWWHIFFHSFAASVAQSSIVIKSPKSALARHAWTQLELALDVFEQAGKGGAPPSAFVPRLKALRDTALASLQAAQTVPTGIVSGQVLEFLMKETDASLSILGPTTRLDRKTRKKSADRSKSSAQCSPSSVTTSRGRQQSEQEAVVTVPVDSGVVNFGQDFATAGNFATTGNDFPAQPFATHFGSSGPVGGTPFGQLDDQFISYGQQAFDHPFASSASPAQAHHSTATDHIAMHHAAQAYPYDPTAPAPMDGGGQFAQPDWNSFAHFAVAASGGFGLYASQQTYSPLQHQTVGAQALQQQQQQTQQTQHVQTGQIPMMGQPQVAAYNPNSGLWNGVQTTQAQSHAVYDAQPQIQNGVAVAGQQQSWTWQGTMGN